MRPFLTTLSFRLFLAVTFKRVMCHPTDMMVLAIAYSTDTKHGVAVLDCRALGLSSSKTVALLEHVGLCPSPSPFVRLESYMLAYHIRRPRQCAWMRISALSRD